MEYSALDSAPSYLMAKRIIASVINDLSTDQRMHKICSSLSEMGFDVTLVGRELPLSLPLSLPFGSHRMKLFFRKGPFFYLEYNIRLFIYLMRARPEIYLANDLDTLLANYLAYANTAGAELVYDSHEYFTEVPEIQGRWVKKVWMAIEKWIFPKLKHAYTVNQSIADIYSNKYEVPVGVVRNVPNLEGIQKVKSRADLGLPEDQRIIILQGAGINMDRGGEEAVGAMAHLSDEYMLVVAGSGDRIPQMKDLCKEKGLDAKVRFEERMPYKDLMQFTFNADLGLTLDKGDSGNYIYALPNKIMDYLVAGIPILGSPMHEAMGFIQRHDVGMVVTEVGPKEIARSVEAIFSDTPRLNRWKENAERTRAEVNWAMESERLKKIYEPLV